MKRKIKEKAYNAFYNEYAFLDKYNYIKKVMESCKTGLQLDNAFNWGKSVLWGYLDALSKKYKDLYEFRDWLSIWNYSRERLHDIVADLTKEYGNLLLKIKTSVAE